MFDSVSDSAHSSPTSNCGRLHVPLEKLAPHWPRSIRDELAAHAFGATLAIPMDELGDALRHGKVKFPWNRLRAWINPPLPSERSERGELSLELPLPVVAPLFSEIVESRES